MHPSQAVYNRAIFFYQKAFFFCNFKTFSELLGIELLLLGLAVHVCNLSTRGLRQKDLEFEASLRCIARTYLLKKKEKSSSYFNAESLLSLWLICA